MMEEKKRIIGLDYLRILSMFGILMLHVLGAGGILDASKTEAGYSCNFFFEIIFMASVDVFAILSGYLSINKTKTAKRTFELAFIVLFYCVVITSLFVVFKADVRNLKTIICGIFPMLKERYWYITCYIPILFFQPLINRMLNCLSIPSYRFLVIGSILVFCILPEITLVDFFRFINGYSSIWLLICYIIGGYLRKSQFSFLTKHKKIVIITYLLIPVLLLFGNMLINTLFGGHHGYMVFYTSPTILLFSIISVFLFSKINGKQSVFIKYLSLLTFDVYIIHAHIFVYDYIITGAFKWIVDLPALSQPFIAMICGVGIYIMCTILGFLRYKLFKLIKIEKLLSQIENKIELLMN